ncbi:MAG: DUF547 domain-containing protein [Pirellulales bacterium]
MFSRTVSARGLAAAMCFMVVLARPDQAPAAGKKAAGPADFDAILKQYVQGDFFDYAGLKGNQDDLARFERFLRWQAEADPSGMTRGERIAFYINAYNACCIKAILDHYPLHSPKDVDGFFDKLKFRVGGEDLTVNEIEYERLIADHRDMRAHFAVVCADRGCLPLKDGAYTAERLDKDLEHAARRFVGDERHFKVDQEKREVHISKIFEWYGEKFLNDPDRPVAGDRPELYLLHWLDGDTRRLVESGDYKLKIIEWDWTLNEKIE